MKLFSVKLSAKMVVITFVATVFFCLVVVFSFDTSNTFVVWYVFIWSFYIHGNWNWIFRNFKIVSFVYKIIGILNIWSNFSY